MQFFSRWKTYTYGVPGMKSALKRIQTSRHAQQTYVCQGAETFGTEEVTGEEASSEGQGWRT